MTDIHSAEKVTAPEAGGLTPADLEEMILQFNETTNRLQTSHVRLQARVQELTRELEEKDEALRHKRRLEALGEMAAGIAHEIRNPLGGIQLYASLLEKDLDGEEEKLRLIRKIIGGVKHLNTIVEDMLAYTKTLAPVWQQIDVHRVLEEALGYAAAEIEQTGLQVHKSFATELPTLLADPNLLQRIFLNIILNAGQAVEQAGLLNIETYEQGGEIVVCFTDSGPGIPEEIMEKIFNPFFTRRDKGTGLGLAIVQRIVESHKGTVTAHNATGGGAVFTVTLPVASNA